jgi:hypothetical protein
MIIHYPCYYLNVPCYYIQNDKGIDIFETYDRLHRDYNNIITNYEKKYNVNWNFKLQQVSYIVYKHNEQVADY